MSYVPNTRRDRLETFLWEELDLEGTPEERAAWETRVLAKPPVEAGVMQNIFRASVTCPYCGTLHIYRRPEWDHGNDHRYPYRVIEVECEEEGLRFRIRITPVSPREIEQRRTAIRNQAKRTRHAMNAPQNRSRNVRAWVKDLTKQA